MFIRYTRECLEAAEGNVPKDADGKRPLRIEVFESWFMEHVLGRAHPITPIVWFGPVIGYGLHQALSAQPIGGVRTAGLFAVGALAWTLSEYLLHRFVFHMNAETPEEKLRVFLMHGYHHEFPSDPMRLVAPPLMSWPLGLLVWGAYHFTVGGGASWALFAGTCAGYIAYDWTHYYTHHFKPTTALGKWIRNYHLQHHHDSFPGRYGVSSPLWDLVFGTFEPPKKARR